MELSITKRGLDLISALAEYEVLTTGQMVQLLVRNDGRHVDARNAWATAGLVKLEPAEAVGRGLPDPQAFLIISAVELLRTHDRFPADVPADSTLPGGLPPPSRHRLLSWFRFCSILGPELTQKAQRPA